MTRPADNPTQTPAALDITADREPARYLAVVVA